MPRFGGAFFEFFGPHSQQLVRHLSRSSPAVHWEQWPMWSVTGSRTTLLFRDSMKKSALVACVVTLLSIAPALSQNAPPGNPTNTGFMAQQPGDLLASRLVGLGDALGIT